MIKEYINTLKKQNKPLTKFDGLMWGSLLESATIKDKDTIVFKFKDGTEINGLGTAVEELIVEENLQNIKFKKYAWRDEFIKHGSVEELEKIYCDFDSILEMKK